MHTNMMLALVALTIVMLATPAAASTPAPPTTPAPPLPCDFQNSTDCSLVLECTWNTDDNKCEIYVRSDDGEYYVILAVFITIVVVCKCGGLVGFCPCWRKDDKKVEDQQPPQEGVSSNGTAAPYNHGNWTAPACSASPSNWTTPSYSTAAPDNHDNWTAPAYTADKQTPQEVEDQQTPQEGVDKHTLQEVVVQQPPQEQEVVVKETPQANANPY